MLTLAVPKGRILVEASTLLKKSGIIEKEINEGRKLVVEEPQRKLKFILAKPQDIPTYVKYGIADVGIAGKDVLMEWGEGLYELMDLKIGTCRISICGKDKQKINNGKMLRIGTKYPKVTSNYFKEKGQQVEVIKLNGSVELAPILGLSDFIVDIVSTGRTLKENGLVELECISPVTCRLIVNQASYYLKNQIIKNLLDKLEVGVSNDWDN